MATIEIYDTHYFLMEDFITNGCNSSILKVLKNVCVYLKISVISDIIDSTGTIVQDWAIHGPPKMDNHGMAKLPSICAT